MTLLVLALVGTDHHPFERFVELIDAAAVRHPEHRFLVQHGATSGPSTADGVTYLTHDDLDQRLADCDLVICHGGPATIMDARSHGHLPLCIPRDPALGEHVDGHQLAFAVQASHAGLVRTVQADEPARALLDGAILDLEQGRWPGRAAVATSDQALEPRRRAARELDALIGTRPRRRDALRRMRRLR
ncbi:MAG: glycosyltransferase [Ornithinimicrobium sp.]